MDPKGFPPSNSFKPLNLFIPEFPHCLEQPFLAVKKIFSKMFFFLKKWELVRIQLTLNQINKILWCGCNKRLIEIFSLVFDYCQKYLFYIKN